MMAVMLGIVAAGFLVAKTWGEELPVGGRMWGAVFAAVFAQSGIIEYLDAEGLPGSSFLFAVVGGSLLFASVTDCQSCQVYRFTWWPVYVTVLPFLWRLERKELLFLILFIFLQFFVFQRMYGRGDCIAFSVCAAVKAATGAGFTDYVVHMLFAWLLLVLAQALRRNIDRSGKLKEPVPFLPYITAAFWLSLL